MTKLDHGELRVEVPVGFLLSEEQELSVSVDRPGGDPLPIRLRLIPARPSVVPDTDYASERTPLSIGWPSRRGSELQDDGYHGFDVGGGD